MMETFTCSHCGAEHPITDRIAFGGQELCTACLEANTCVCSRCGDRIWLDRSCGTSSMPLCADCEERYYDHCADCGCLVERGTLLYLVDPDEDCDDEEGEDGYCPQCYARHTLRGSIQTYNYKPEPIFYGDGERFFGVELEIDGAGEDGENANLIQTVANRYNDHLYVKHDGSLDAGLELVTHPMTLDYHRNNMPWEAVLQKALRLGYTSHQTDTCGLHVHVNRSSLGDFWDEQEDVIARILFLVETLWHELLRFSRRTQSQMDKWASRYGRRDDPKDVLHNAKSRCDRYTCVNLTPRKTIEFRMFSSKPLSHIALPDTAADLLAQYDEACEELEAVTERKQQAENLLKEMMGDNEIGTAGDRIVTWKSVSQERLDSKTLKAEHPALYKKYANQTSYRRFTIKAAS